ncbi:Kelch repeat-containing protein 3 [Marasmius tenuissimus]|uniref:Kelch repeat-containing protein 3 n=1 Tax=Marasmius tenuissimus TaxID=585030 RepID=A0ABR2ZNH9_9AGAR
MAKKKEKSTAKEAKAAKKAKAALKTEKKATKKAKSNKKEEDSDDDLEAILDNFRREWESAHAVTEELVEGPPSRRANATLTACPNGNHLWCIGGEWFSEDGRAVCGILF